MRMVQTHPIRRLHGTWMKCSQRRRKVHISRTEGRNADTGGGRFLHGAGLSRTKRGQKLYIKVTEWKRHRQSTDKEKTKYRFKGQKTQKRTGKTAHTDVWKPYLSCKAKMRKNAKCTKKDAEKTARICADIPSAGAGYENPESPERRSAGVQGSLPAPQP